MRTPGADHVTTLELGGRLTHALHPALRAKVFPLLELPGLRTLRIDLSAVEYVDSSTLGLFLLIRERAEQAGVELVFVRPTPALMGEFRVVQFHRLLSIEN
ncbi:MAG TPA: STAS domain-containing protein [Holophagaceae bacterium]|nr:STAS domain-containing protein [Holophagaceae bacterium]